MKVYSKMAYLPFFILWGVSISSMYWGRELLSSESLGVVVLMNVVVPSLGLIAVCEYLSGKDISFGFIRARKGDGAVREIVFAISIFLLISPIYFFFKS